MESLASVWIVLCLLPRPVPVTADMLTTIITRDPTIASAQYVARNVWIQPELRDLVDESIAASPTFREQIRVLATSPRAHVAVSIDPSLRQNAARAQCTLTVYSSGLIIASVVVPDRRDAQELIAHEFEHIIERLQGVRLASEVTRKTPGVWRLADGRFETLRAQEAGLRVKAELARSRLLLTSR